MQKSDSTFCWGQVAVSVGVPTTETSSDTSLKKTFGLLAAPLAICLSNDSTFTTANAVYTDMKLEAAQVTNTLALKQRIGETSPYQPTICLIDFTLLNEVSVESICEMLANHLSYSIILMRQYSVAGNRNARPHPSLPVQCLLQPLEQNELRGKTQEFLVQASQLSSHLMNMRNLEKLDEREKILVQLISYGMPNKKSANILGLAEKTIEKCRTGIYRKLGVRSTGELASLITLANFYRWPLSVDFPVRKQA